MKTRFAFRSLLSAACCGAALFAFAPVAASAADAKPIPVADVKHDGPVDFEKEILPILKKNCTACHNYDLCAKCEADPTLHPVTHAMLKIRQPIDCQALRASAATQKPVAKDAKEPQPTRTPVVPKPKHDFKVWSAPSVSACC